LLKIKDKTILDYHLQRLSESKLPIFVATSTLPADDQIAAFCQSKNYNCFRGDEQNVLSRFVGCAEKFNLDAIVRVTSDCPLVDGELIAQAAQDFLAENNPNSYVSNGLMETYPRGFDFEIFSLAALQQATLNATTTEQKEHVTPYLINNVSGKMQLTNIAYHKSAQHFRLTLDTKEDFILIEKLISDYNADELNCDAIISLLEKHPELSKINAHIQQKTTHQ